MNVCFSYYFRITAYNNHITFCFTLVLFHEFCYYHLIISKSTKSVKFMHVGSLLEQFFLKLYLIVEGNPLSIQREILLEFNSQLQNVNGTFRWFKQLKIKKIHFCCIASIKCGSSLCWLL